MKTDFSINVQVNIGVTPEVVQLITSILQRTPPTEIAPAAIEQPEATAPAKPKPGKGKAKQEAPAPDAEVAQNTTEAAPEAEAQAEETAAAPAGPKELTEQDIREAMHRTRQRIEGEDYKNNTDSEGYKKYHKQLTATFKNIASLLGSDKPSTLPADKRGLFIKQCDELVLQNGEIVTPCPY